MTEISHEALVARLAQLKAQAEAWPDHRRTWQRTGQRHHRFENGAREAYQAVNTQASEPDGWDQILIARATPDQANHIATWHPGMALAVITNAEETLREHRPDEVDLWHAGESHPACAGPHLDEAADDESGDVWWHECPYVLGVTSWAMPKEGE